MTIIPIHPDDAEPAASEHSTTSLLDPRRALGRRGVPSRRTLGIRKPSRRTLGRRGIPSRRTLMPRTKF
jgi:hypothetical protein